VYGILSVQLAVTAGAVCLVGLHPDLARWMQTPRGLGAAVPIASLLLSTVAWVYMSMSVRARRSNPLKWQVLSLFTIGEAISVAYITSFYTFQSVLSAMLATATAATGVSAYTIMQKNSKYDLSQWGATLSSFGLVFVVYGIISVLQLTNVLPANFLPYNDAVYGMIGSTLFSFYLAYHTRLIVSGRHTKYQMNEKDYVFGASTCYYLTCTIHCRRNMF
jgi:protein lifeguard